MKRTQIQLPDSLFQAAHELADAKEISMAELVRRGLEYMLAVAPDAKARPSEWELPPALDLHSRDPFREDDWRGNLHMTYSRIFDARLAETLRHHGVTEFATRNEKDFREFGFHQVWNPLA